MTIPVLNTNLDNLKSKFYPFLLGHKECKADSSIKDKIDTIFQNFDKLRKLDRENVFTNDEWVIKGARIEADQFSDVHLYRIRKAEKIRNYIEKNNLQNDLVVPEKFLYWEEKSGKFYVVSRKINLSTEVASIGCELFIKSLEACPEEHVGQIKAYFEDKPQRDITRPQAKALAKLAIFAGYTDLTYNNLYFTHDGKIAIIDTEPLHRGLKKKVLAKSKFKFIEKSYLLNLEAILGIALLKLYLKNPLALEEVQRIERRLVWNEIVKNIAIIFCTFVVAGISIPCKNFKLRIVVKLVIYSIAMQIAQPLFEKIRIVLDIWNKSCEGFEGVNKLLGLKT